MSLPRPLVGDTIKVSYHGKSSLHQIAHTTGQFVFAGNHRFHINDDRIGDKEWRANQVSFILMEPTPEGAKDPPSAA